MKLLKKFDNFGGPQHFRTAIGGFIWLTFITLSMLLFGWKLQNNFIETEILIKSQDPTTLNQQKSKVFLSVVQRKSDGIKTPSELETYINIGFYKKSSNYYSEQFEYKLLKQKPCNLDDPKWKTSHQSRLHKAIYCFDEDIQLQGLSFDSQEALATPESLSLIFSIQKSDGYKNLLDCQTPSCEEIAQGVASSFINGLEVHAYAMTPEGPYKLYEYPLNSKSLGTDQLLLNVGKIEHIRQTQRQIPTSVKTLPSSIKDQSDRDSQWRSENTIYTAELSQSLMTKNTTTHEQMFTLEQVVSMWLGECIIVYLLLDFLVRPLKNYLLAQKAQVELFTRTLLSADPQRDRIKQLNDQISIKARTQCMDFFKSMCGMKPPIIYQAEREIQKSLDIIEIVRALRVIRRSPYFDMKVYVGEESETTTKIIPNFEEELSNLECDEEVINMTVKKLETKADDSRLESQLQMGSHLQMYSTGFSFHKKEGQRSRSTMDNLLPPIHRENPSQVTINQLKDQMNQIYDQQNQQEEQQKTLMEGKIKQRNRTMRKTNHQSQNQIEKSVNWDEESNAKIEI